MPKNDLEIVALSLRAYRNHFLYDDLISETFIFYLQNKCCDEKSIKRFAKSWLRLQTRHPSLDIDDVDEKVFAREMPSPFWEDFSCDISVAKTFVNTLISGKTIDEAVPLRRVADFRSDAFASPCGKRISDGSAQGSRQDTSLRNGL